VAITWRPSALSAVSTGTSIGVAGAGIAAILMSLNGTPWRVCWAVFATAGLLAVAANWAALRHLTPAANTAPSPGWRAMLRRSSAPLFAIGLSYGATSAIYISFAADHIEQAGGVPGLASSAAPALVFICFGLFGLLGLWTGRVKAQIGLPALLRALLVASAASFGLVVLAPTAWAGLVISAGLQGIVVMMTSAVLAFWSERLVPARPSQGFTAALLALAAGSVLGPAAAGYVAEGFGPEAMFWGAAAVAVITTAIARTSYITEQPVAGWAGGSA
jgi:predicted MFS family arabinose efflux permease